MHFDRYVLPRIKFFYTFFYLCILGLGSSKKKPKSEDDLQILQEIPGKSGLGAASLSSLSSLLGSGGSISGAGGTNPFFNTPSLLQAQDPYFSLNALQPGSSSAANSMDILQKCKFSISFTYFEIFQYYKIFIII